MKGSSHKNIFDKLYEGLVNKLYDGFGNAITSTAGSGSKRLLDTNDPNVAALIGALSNPAAGTVLKFLTDMLAKWPDQSGGKVPVVQSSTPDTAAGDFAKISALEAKFAAPIDGMTPVVSGFRINVTAPIEETVPSSTSAYIAGDRLGPATGSAPKELTNMATANGRGGVITMLQCTLNKKSITPRLRIHFFNANDATLSADNFPWQEKYVDGTKRVAYYDLPALTTAIDATNSDCSRIQDLDVRIPYKCAANSTSLWYAVETLDGVTFQNDGKISLVVKAELN